MIDEWCNTSDYVYNKTVQCIREGDKLNFMDLGNKLVTEETQLYNAEYIDYKKNKQRLYSIKNQLDKDLPLCGNELDAENVKTQIAFIENEITNQLNNLKELKKTMKKEKVRGLLKWEFKSIPLPLFE